jgi:hypothetical protein
MTKYQVMIETTTNVLYIEITADNEAEAYDIAADRYFGAEDLQGIFVQDSIA